MEERIRIGDVADAVDEGLARLQRRGLRRGHCDRFALYTRRLRRMAAGPFPTRLPEDLEDRDLFFEGAAQCSLLLTALELVPHIDGRLLFKKLEPALSGPALPRTKRGTNDEARNYLLELGVGALLLRKGFMLDVVGEEDWTATFDGLPPFVVECTRPTHAGTLSKGLKHVHEQLILKGRADGTRTFGLPAIGLDGVFGLRGTYVFPNKASLEHTVVRALDAGIRRVKRLQRKLHPPFLPAVPIGAVALFTSVFLEDVGAPYGVSQIGLYCVDEQDPRVTEVVEKLSPRIGKTSAQTRRPPVVVPVWPPRGRYLTYEPRRW